jgi:hypothetical protein
MNRLVLLSSMCIELALQELQRVVDAIVCAPHVEKVNGRGQIPLGNSDIRRAMYGNDLLTTSFGQLHAMRHHARVSSKLSSCALGINNRNSYCAYCIHQCFTFL